MPNGYHDPQAELASAYSGLGSWAETARRLEQELAAARDLSWIGAEPVVERTTFGQGSFGHRCRLCCADDYAGPLTHHPKCPGR